MKHSVICVGLDVHKDSIDIAPAGEAMGSIMFEFILFHLISTGQ